MSCHTKDYKLTVAMYYLKSSSILNSKTDKQ